MYRFARQIKNYVAGGLLLLSPISCGGDPTGPTDEPPVDPVYRTEAELGQFVEDNFGVPIQRVNATLQISTTFPPQPGQNITLPEVDYLVTAKGLLGQDLYIEVNGTGDGFNSSQSAAAAQSVNPLFAEINSGTGSQILQQIATAKEKFGIS